MRKEYDFSKGIKNPYTNRLRKQITINVDNDVIDYFKKLSTEVGIPYQTLINMYLVECARKKRKINIRWE